VAPAHRLFTYLLTLKDANLMCKVTIQAALGAVDRPWVSF